MGESVRLYGPAVLAWALLLWAPHGRRRQSEPSRRVVRLILAGLAASATLGTPAVYSLVAELSGVPNLARLLGHAGMLLVAWGAYAFFRLMSDPAPVAGTLGVRYAGGLFAALAVMAALFAAAPTPVDDVRFAARYAAAPWVLEYWLALLVAVVPAFWGVILRGWRCSVLAASATLRLGLRLVIVGALCAKLYVLHKAVFFGAARFGLDYPPEPRAALDALLPLFAHVLVLLGATLPGWGPRLRVPQALEWLDRYRAYRELRPLWLALYRAVPEIALVPPVSAAADLSPADLRLRLYRRVIEIRDARLALSPYFDAGVGAAARRLTGSMAPLEDGTMAREEALAEAGMLAVAMTRDRSQDAHGTASGPDPLAERAPGGGDLESDIAFLGEVAWAYRRYRRTFARWGLSGAPTVGVGERTSHQRSA
ncbi:MAB_1171c family putative transporter [Spongiactinospora sp. TRM90649]|uniref:MAB_1171c family putative transporter n=1 Tax=Spongiactinospora sp. TRM90649 TaxID=3031114 RepID=UPI0023F9415A|nr:MAB_1171c family putative transporter [Spongiactinospora sp. TRM90649]MDF5757912.1 hypothetical protein [Spongiactinospora sp. TRM90649]